ncbi:hypothetical protein N9L06_00990 [Mariniblastus sp.]|nr:hypothetical protein [Mariniblastus sp.]
MWQLKSANAGLLGGVHSQLARITNLNLTVLDHISTMNTANAALLTGFNSQLAGITNIHKTIFDRTSFGNAALLGGVHGQLAGITNVSSTVLGLVGSSHTNLLTSLNSQLNGITNLHQKMLGQINFSNVGLLDGVGIRLAGLNLVTEALREARESWDFSEDNFSPSERDWELAADHFDEVFSLSPSDDFLAKIAEVVTVAHEKQKRGLLKATIVLIILPFVIGLVNDYVSKVLFTAQPQQVDKTTVQAIKETNITINNIYPSLIDTLNTRIVRRQTDVWLAPHKKGVVIDTLYTGSVVQVIHRQKKWRLVQWYDQDCERLVDGWVRSKYLTSPRRVCR